MDLLKKYIYIFAKEYVVLCDLDCALATNIWKHMVFLSKVLSQLSYAHGRMLVITVWGIVETQHFLDFSKLIYT